MNTENLKITTYADNVKDLPDYPSDEGYTAAQLKAMFDARSDKEIKEKHNALVDAMSAEISELKTADGTVEQNAKEYAEGLVSEHDEAGNSHGDIRTQLSEMESEITEAKAYADGLIEKLEGELGVTESDNGISEKKVNRANTAFYADEASYANQASKDGDGNKISTTYATKDALEEVNKKTDIGTETKPGIFYLASVDDAIKGAREDAVLTPYHILAIFEDRMMLFTNKNIDDGVSGMSLDYPPSTGYVHDYVAREVGDISTALDELHAYAETLIGGEE